MDEEPQPPAQGGYFYFSFRHFPPCAIYSHLITSPCSAGICQPLRSPNQPSLSSTGLTSCIPPCYTESSRFLTSTPQPPLALNFEPTSILPLFHPPKGPEYDFQLFPPYTDSNPFEINAINIARELCWNRRKGCQPCPLLYLNKVF